MCRCPWIRDRIMLILFYGRSTVRPVFQKHCKVSLQKRSMHCFYSFRTSKKLQCKTAAPYVKHCSRCDMLSGLQCLALTVLVPCLYSCSKTRNTVSNRSIVANPHLTNLVFLQKFLVFINRP